jgi:transposase
MLQELRVAEQRLRAVWEVLDGASVSEVARRFKVLRQSVHTWLRRYAADRHSVIVFPLFLAAGLRA